MFLTACFLPVSFFIRCCSASCEFCGGHGCSSNTGGAGNCCANAITTANEVCDADKAAPCLLSISPA